MDASLGILSDGFTPPISLSEAIAEQLGRAIAEGRLQPNQRLKELELCSEFGVSRTPMREALRIVASEGLVELSSRRGARVAELTTQSITDVFLVRMALEGLAAGLAAREISLQEIHTLRNTNDAMLKAARAGDARTFFVFNRDFHRRLAVASRNPYLATLQESAAARSFRPLFLSLSPSQHLIASVTDHGDLLRAIESRDSRKSEKLMKTHIANAEREALRVIQSSLHTPGR